MSTKKLFPMYYYTVAIGIIGSRDEFEEEVRFSPMLPDWGTYLKLRYDLVQAGLFDDDGLPTFDNLKQAMKMLKAYLAKAPEDRFGDFESENHIEETDSEDISENDF